MNARRSMSRLSLPRTLALAGLLALSAGSTLASGALADNDWWRYRSSRSHGSADGSLIDVEVRVDGESTPLYFKSGSWDRHYFQAFRGKNYSLVMRNNTAERIGVLIAVDGLNVVNGERSRLGRGEAMYVLGPWENATIRGWRTSLDEVRRFVFVDEERSYAERTGQANGDMGWIRVLSFRENRPWYGWGKMKSGYRDGGEAPYGGRDREEMAPAPEGSAPQPSAPAPMAGGDVRAKGKDEARRNSADSDGPAAENNPGTGWGERRHDEVREVEFQAARQATDHLVLRYEYAAGLRALGIFPRRSRLHDRERGELGFAQPPRW